MGRKPYSRPTEPFGTFKLKFQKAFEHLAKVHLGPFRFLYSDEHDALFLQASQKTGKEFLSVAKIDSDGNISFSGTVTPSDTLENPGRYTL